MLAHFLSCPLPLSFLTEERTWEAVPLPHTPEGQCGVYFLFSHTFKQLHWTVRGNYMLPAKVSFQVTSWFLWQRRVKEGLLQPEILVTGNSFKQTHMLIIYIYKKLSENDSRGFVAGVHTRDTSKDSFGYICRLDSSCKKTPHRHHIVKTARLHPL